MLAVPIWQPTLSVMTCHIYKASMAGECFVNVTDEFAGRLQGFTRTEVSWEEEQKGASGCLEALQTVFWGTELWASSATERETVGYIYLRPHSTLRLMLTL